MPFQKFLLTVFCLVFFLKLTSQNPKEDSQVPWQGYPLEDLIQAYVESRADDGDFDFNTLMDQVEQLLKHPIDINDQDALDDFVLLRPSQILSLKNYLVNHGDLISVLELQAVPEFDINTIRLITPFIKLGTELNNSHLSLSQLVSRSSNQLFIRTGRYLETKRGDTAGYQGGPSRLYWRYRQAYENKWSIGITGEKDPGEDFFRGSNKNGFDYNSFHLSMRKVNTWMEGIVIGDYTISFGQGLLIHSGFGVGKSPWSTNIRKGDRVLRPYTSVNESSYFRGIASSLNISKNISATVFGSLRKKDGNILSDSLDRETLFSSFQESGYHRTSSEISDEKKINEKVIGGAVKYRWSSGHIGWNSMYSSFNRSFNKSDEPYNQFTFRGKSLTQWSMDHSYQWRNFNFFGELAGCDPGGTALIEGVQLALDKKIDVAFLYRDLGRSYAALYSNAFSENTLANNERGFYVGTEIRPSTRWKIAAYWDTWLHPWLRFGVQGPSRGNEQLLRFTYTIRRKMEIYLQYRNKLREENNSTNESIRRLINNQKKSMRINVAYHWSRSIETRTRIEMAQYHKEISSKGWMIYQDLLYSSLESPFSFTTRFSVFNTESYDSGIYAYENDLLYNFYVPNYNGKGIRMYYNLRYDGLQNITLEGRYAITRLNDITSIGNGLDQILGNKRSELKFQARWTF